MLIIGLHCSCFMNEKKNENPINLFVALGTVRYRRPIRFRIWTKEIDIDNLKIYTEMDYFTMATDPRLEETPPQKC